MRIGNMRSRITIQTLGGSTDAGGGQTTTWSALDTPIWAHIRPLSGREIQMANAQVGVVTHEIRIRYRTDVTTAHRILLGSRTFNIKVVLNPDDNNQMLLLKCEEGVAT